MRIISQACSARKSAALALCFALSLALCSRLKAAVNVSFSAGAPTSLQDEFIKGATSQYVGVLTKSPYFAGTYSLIISSKNFNYIPPAVSSPIATATAVDQCMAYGFGQGMDAERWYNKQLVYSLQGADFAGGTCGFQTVGFSTSAVSVSTTSCANQCWQVYNVIVSTIQERWGYVYDPTGFKVAP